jgi:hypothetical protein
LTSHLFERHPSGLSHATGSEVVMCLTCGCGLPHDDHGNAHYITIEHLEKAARADDMRLDEAVKNLAETVEIAKKEPNHLHR